MSVTHTAVLPISEATVEHLAGLLEIERRRRGTGEKCSEQQKTEQGSQQHTSGR
ncbi:hypothetical protein [Nocardia sp. 2YAB30]|uniref:hypothetical protein n=1 Tax=Nocardia sp. 2YAB30 TaxID=3233022 RepID=UPI003F990F71